jgi:hypothetical protein
MQPRQHLTQRRDQQQGQQQMGEYGHSIHRSSDHHLEQESGGVGEEEKRWTRELAVHAGEEETLPLGEATRDHLHGHYHQKRVVSL